jgi:transposase
MSVAQAARDLDIHASTLRNWLRQQTAGSKSAFAGRWHMKPEQQEIERPRSEVKNLKSERNIPKKP